MSKSGAQIQNPRGIADRRTSEEHAVGGAVHATSGGRENMTKAVFPRQYWIAPVLWARDCLPGPLPPSAYKLPLGVLQKGIQRVEFLKQFLGQFLLLRVFYVSSSSSSSFVFFISCRSCNRKESSTQVESKSACNERWQSMKASLYLSLFPSL